MALVEFCYKASSESKKAKVMVVSWKLSWIVGPYGEVVDIMVERWKIWSIAAIDNI